MIQDSCEIATRVEHQVDASALILIVEDNSTNAKLMAQMLTSAGYRVAVAPDGRLGLHCVRTCRPALVITDLQMPVMDGLKLARCLKADPATADIPIIVVTAHAMPEHREQALLAGCSRYLTKPVRYQALMAAVACDLQPLSLGAKPT